MTVETAVDQEKPKRNHDTRRDFGYDVIRIPVKYLADVWVYIMPHMVKGHSANPDMKPEEILAGIVDQSHQLWAVIPRTPPKEVFGVFVTCIERDKGEWVLSLFNLGGKEPRKWVMACHRAMHEYAKAEDCARVRLCGRPAWQRILPGYEVVGEKQGHLIYQRAVD